VRLGSAWRGHRRRGGEDEMDDGHVRYTHEWQKRGTFLGTIGARMAKHPVTMAIRTLRAAGVDFTPHLYTWEPRGGTRASSEALGVDEHAVIKTLIFEDDKKQPLCILMHGDREVSAKNLARTIGTKTVGPCAPDVADKHSGYQVGGTSPFGLKRKMPVYMERTILELPKIYINGGARGFLVEIDPREAERVLKPTLVDVAV
jgi:Cys-tRNA(Pro) deacylase